MKETPVLIPQSTTATPLPSVSVLIPVRNAEATIGTAIDSVLSQDYKGSVEVIVADGSDTAATSDLVRRRYPTVTLVPNPEQVIGFGIQAAQRAATGEIIVRCDAHTVFPPGYVRRSVSTLQRTGAANVGGRQRPVGATFFGRAVAMAMTTPLGAGGARYRLGGAEGPVDTVFLGAYRRDALEAAGGVDPTLVRAEDYELNWRLRARGETVWFDPGLVVDYRPRDTLRDLAWQYFDYGRWKRVVAQRHPASLLLRHLASPLLLLGLAASPVLAVAGASWVAAAAPLTYILTLMLGSLTVGIRRRSYAALLLPLALATMHLSWGIGFLTSVRTKRELTAHPRHFRTATTALPSVSVLLPVRNAEATIGAAIDSVLSQDYEGSVEVIVADGSDTAATSDLVRRRYPTVRLIPNPEQTTGFGLRAAHGAATGEIIVRCDAHSVFPPGYVRRAVSTLQRTGAANVGGRQRPVGTTFFERAVAMAMTTPLGAGGARYRLGGAEGPVDTVFLGAFRRDALEAVGSVDPAFVRNQDYELNWRLRARGETVWFDPGLVVDYRPRGTLWDLVWQYFDYGRWKRVVARRHPASLLPRHLASPLLLLGLAASPVLAVVAGASWAAAAVPLTYVLTLMLGSLTVGIRRRSYAALLLPLVLATMHLSWGIGFFTPMRTKVRVGSTETVAPSH